MALDFSFEPANHAGARPNLLVQFPFLLRNINKIKLWLISSATDSFSVPNFHYKLLWTQINPSLKDTNKILY